MLLNDLFSMLAYGELSNHHMAQVEVGTIDESKQPQVVYFCNEGLKRLYTKYTLKEKDCIIELVEGLTFYHLRPEFSASGYDPTVADFAYIRDLSSDRFMGDVLKVTSVHNSWGRERPLNVNNNIWSVNTPSIRLIQVNNPQFNEVLSVAYQASHPLLELKEGGHKYIELPDSLHGALTAFIASSVYSNMNTAEAQAIGQGHMVRFDTICNEIVETDVLNQSISEDNTRFKLRGWI
jgi:hypothetical protein